MQLPSHETIMVIVKHHRNTLHVEQIDHLDVSLLGQGEANLNVRVIVNQTQPFNLRIGLRNEASERTLQSEFDVLQLVPPGIGPHAFVVDVSRAYLPQPYSILQYLPGELKTAWSDMDLETHAHALAQLHHHKFDQHGSVDRLTDAEFDFLHRFEVALRYWQTYHSDLFYLPSVQRLLPAIRHFVTDHNKLFTELRAFTIVHGDLHPLNILFHGNHLCYVDWEGASIGDPAQDIAMIGWDIATAWQMELTGQRLDMFLDTYLSHEADPTLRLRRDLWMVYTMFFDHLYHRTQISTDSTGKQAYTVRQIEAYLTDRFSKCG
jgi:aminoglycoside phosphotransferase (APT) family kinase protein